MHLINNIIQPAIKQNQQHNMQDFLFIYCFKTNFLIWCAEKVGVRFCARVCILPCCALLWRKLRGPEGACSYSYYPAISSWQREACAGGDGGCIAIRRPSNDRAALFYYFGWLAAAAAGAHNGCTTATAAFIKRRKFTSATACCAPAICIVCWC